MTMITPLPASSPTAQSSATGAQGPEPSVHQEQLTQFLSLLTTQIQNQDPLEPLDSTGFVEQLATFSSLEQQAQTNEHLAALVAIVSGE